MKLIADPTAKAESIATRDGCSIRKVNIDNLACLPRARPRQGCDQKDAFRMAWELSASPTCPPNGPANTGCSGCPRNSSTFSNRVLANCGLRFPPERNFQGGEKSANTSPEPPISGLRDPTMVTDPADSGGLIADSPERLV